MLNTSDNPNEEKDQILGKIKFPLKQITNQDEYDAILEIPDDNNDQLIILKVKAKLRFIWSYSKLFTDLIIKSEKAINIYERSLEKSNQLVESLNGNLRINFNIIEPWKKEENSVNIGHIGQNILTNNDEPEDRTTYNNPNPVSESQLPSEKEVEIADKIEEIAQRLLSIYSFYFLSLIIIYILLDKTYISWNTTIKNLLYVICAISLVNLFSKTDFVNVSINIHFKTLKSFR